MLAAVTLDLDSLAVRLALDIAAIAALALGLFYRRHRRDDLVVLYVIFNIGLFAAVVVISGGQVAAAVGFGLFAVLSIIRLRNETLANAEIAYFFAAIVLGLVTAIDLGGVHVNAALAALVLAAPALIDRPGALRENRRMDVVVEHAIASHGALRGHLEERLGVRIIALEVLELDYVRELTRVSIRVVDVPATVPPAADPDHAALALPR